jgi:hypothetical protein
MEQLPSESGIVPLDKGALAYVLIDIAGARPILEGISYLPMADKNMKQMLDKTQSAAMAVFMPSYEESRRFQLVTWGNYPASGSSIAFGANKDWIRLRSLFPRSDYWYSEAAQMSVVVKPKLAYVLATMTKVPRNPMTSSDGIKIPDGFFEFARGSSLSCWLPDPGAILKQTLNDMGVPLEFPAEQLFICLFPEEDQKYTAQIKIKFKFIGQARVLTNLLFLARRNFTPPPKGAASAQDSAAILPSLLFANPAVQDNNTVFLKLPPLSANDISLLFSLFSL